MAKASQRYVLIPASFFLPVNYITDVVAKQNLDIIELNLNLQLLLY